MAKLKQGPRRIRHVAGILPSSGVWFDISVFDNDSIRIERAYCTIDPRHEFGTIDETDWTAHRHLVGAIAESMAHN